MHIQRRILYCCLVAGAAVAAVTASVTLGSSPRLPAATQRGLEQIVSGGVPGTLALLRDGAATSSATAGAAALGGTRPLGAEQPFRVGSITKSFVATVALQLVDQGRLDLTDTVQRWLPDLVPRGDEITVRHLLQHTSGIADDEQLLQPLLYDPAHAFEPIAVARAAARTPLRFEPGHGWSYANANYVLLGLIVEQATGRPLTTELRERVIRPLGLRHTLLPTDGSLPAQAARGYLPPGNPVSPQRAGRYLDVTRTNPSWTWAAGALVSTAGDVSRFYRALLAGELLPRPLLSLMLASRPTGDGTGYGLGLLRADTPCGPAFGHDGEIFGYTSLALTHAESGRSIVLLANASHPGGNRSLLAAFLALAGNALCTDAGAAR